MFWPTETILPWNKAMKYSYLLLKELSTGLKKVNQKLIDKER